ncbi:glutamine amidotransferase [Tundrisphaera sp. TA3]|uniref:glutamine amidotransferase n=1 Tax=Tundrisphaera sp. TA3 TaxID=3435775 RepID=UPI003EBADF23
MTVPTLILGTPGWWAVAAGLMALAAAVIAWSYGRAGGKPSVRLACALLKAAGLAALSLILLEPLLTGTRPRKGANSFAVLVDNSRSLQIRDRDDQRSRGDWVRDQVRSGSPWATRLGQDFDARSYVFDSHLRSVEGFDTALDFDGPGTALGSSLTALAKRFRGLPLAGVLLFTDGNRTDLAGLDWSALPPIYPVIPPARGVARDVGVRDVAVSQTNFEAAPVVLRAEVSAVGFGSEPIVAAVFDEAGAEVERQQAKASADGRPLSFRFQFRPIKAGVNFYQVRAFPASEEPKAEAGQVPANSSEQTLANNRRLVVVDQGGGPYRVLYVGGRPNWEFKFLRRALSEDEQIQLVGLLRIARRQPKFDFQASRNRTTSPLFDGFDNPDGDTAEASDRPVLIRLNTLDEVELRDGFPKTAEELFKYHAIVLDDLEAGFFTPDQLALVRNFVGVRGGGLLMLGGPDSFAQGKYDRTPIGELLPVYLNGPASAATFAGDCRLVLTREGWLQPWVRTRKSEDEERKRLAAMPAFQTLSLASGIKPGAVTLAEVADESGNPVPALVAQMFGKGHVAALMIGDLWRWGIRRETPEEDDLDRSWRQTARWLVSDVPGRVELTVKPDPDAASNAVDLIARVRDAEFRPLDNAKVTLRLTLPGGDTLSLDAEPDARESGLYAASFAPKQAGAHRVVASAAMPDGSAIGEREAGWAAQPSADEFARLEPDRGFLAEIASRTGGEVVDGRGPDALVSGLMARGAPITEPWTAPLWHHPLYFAIAILCFAAEWGLRRVNGLP